MTTMTAAEVPTRKMIAACSGLLEDRPSWGHIKQSWLESGAVYGYRKVSDDLRDLVE